ncbi:MAG: GWxTD domain-containing protein [Chitinophagales bacterium]|nr:GWxTD domain-containing protein [Chitinophagales bacterium]MDW8427674.1 GWxTD domain-containing protein [Chitinophagales bacterium]
MLQRWGGAFGLLCCAAVIAAAQNLRLYMNCQAFYIPEKDSVYLETTVATPGFALTYVRTDNHSFQAALNIYLQFEKDTVVVATDSYRLNTPPLPDTSNLNFTLLDLHRVFLPPGEYTVKLYASDANRPEVNASFSQGVDARFSRQEPAVSEITLVQHFQPAGQPNIYTKYGFDIKPLVVPYFGPEQNRLDFYAEIYNTDLTARTDDVIVFYSVRSALSHQVAQQMHRFTKQKTDAINVLFGAFDISELPTGNYYLLVEVRNKNNEFLASQVRHFHREHTSLRAPVSDFRMIDISGTFAEALAPDSLNYYLKCLIPTADLEERSYILSLVKTDEVRQKQQFFYAFWQRRSDQPYTAWQKYKQEVDVVNYYYSTPTQYGFETDRGRVYLQYGAPNSIEGHPFEAGAYPYEIWHYYQLGNNQRNVRFVFCNMELATNNYTLIHSDARGELYDPRWRFRIYRAFRESSDYYNLDETRFRPVFGSQVDKLFER